MINRIKIKKIFTLKKKDVEDYRLTYKLAKRFFITYCIIAVVTILVSIIFNVKIVDNGDFLNWTSFVLELALGAYVAIAILTYENVQKAKSEKQQERMANLLQQTKTQQDKITELVIKIEKIEGNQQKMIDEQYEILKNEQKRKERWMNDWGILILTSIESIKNMYEILETWLVDYKNNPSAQLKDNIINSAKNNAYIVVFHIDNIKKWLPKIETYFNDPTLSTQLVGFSEQLTPLFESLHMDYHWESNLETAFSVISERKQLLLKFIERMKKEIP